jgi:molybdopterin-guanine dinucleotide biosynthesis protein A
MLERGFIQSGGRSSRMGRDKAWIEIESRTMIERVIDAARPAVEQLAVVVSRDFPNIGDYRRLAGRKNAGLIFDLHEHRGPLGGIHTALSHCVHGESALVLACDLPFITAEFLTFICDLHRQDGEQDVTVPIDRSNRLQPLAAVYSRSCLEPIERMLAADELKVDLLYHRVAVRRVEFAEIAHLPDAERFFININTPEDI